jgi:hypothetical protein
MTKPYDSLEAARQLEMWKMGWLTDVFEDTEILEVRTANGQKIGKISALKTNIYKKRKYEDTIVRPFIDKLADKDVSSIADHNDRIDAYAYSYDQGFDPLTGVSLKGVESDTEEYAVSQKSKNFVREPLPSCRGQVIPNLENLKIIMGLILDDEFVGRVEDYKLGL